MILKRSLASQNLVKLFTQADVQRLPTNNLQWAEAQLGLKKRRDSKLKLRKISFIHLLFKRSSRKCPDMRQTPPYATFWFWDKTDSCKKFIEIFFSLKTLKFKILSSLNKAVKCKTRNTFLTRKRYCWWKNAAKWCKYSLTPKVNNYWLVGCSRVDT